MSAHLTKQQIIDFKEQLMSRFIEMQREIQQESELFTEWCSNTVDPELEGCINLLFDLNFVDVTGVSESSIKH